MIIILVLIINHLLKYTKLFQKKLYKNFGVKDKRCTFAPAKEDSNAFGAERTTRTLT